MGARVSPEVQLKNLFPKLVTLSKESPDKRARKTISGELIPWDGILIHHTGTAKGTFDGNVNYLTRPDLNYVSAHFVISEAGKAAQLVNPETHVAYHAGTSAHWSPHTRKVESGCNDRFIGVELVGNGNLEGYPLEQYEKLAQISAALMIVFPSINPLCIVGHEMVAPGRKVDPGAFFNWRLFYSLLFGELRTFTIQAI